MGFRISQYFLIVLYLSFLFTDLFLPQPANAEAIEMEYTLGFNGVLRLKDWTPLTVVMENRHQGIHGQLEVVVTSGSEYRNDISRTTYSVEADLPNHSKKTFTFTILIDSYAHPLIIRLIKEKEIILSKSINLRGHYVTKPLLIFAGENPNDLSLPVTEAYQPVYTPIRFLPETWYGYHGVKGLIMKAGMWKNLRPGQYAGLTQWIKAGGFVITSGSLEDTSLSLERLERLMSVRLVGLERVREVPALKDFCGEILAHLLNIPDNSVIDNIFHRGIASGTGQRITAKSGTMVSGNKNRRPVFSQKSPQRHPASDTLGQRHYIRFDA